MGTIARRASGLALWATLGLWGCHGDKSDAGHRAAVLIGSLDGFSTGVVVESGGHRLVLTTRHVVSASAAPSVYAVARDGTRSTVRVHPASVLWSDYALDLAVLDVTGADELRPAVLASSAEIDELETRAPLTLWGSTLADLAHVEQTDVVAVPARWIGRHDLPLAAGDVQRRRGTGRTSAEGLRGPRGVDVWTRTIPRGFVGAPAFDSAGRLIGVMRRTEVDADETSSLIAAEELRAALDRAAVPAPPDPDGDAVLRLRDRLAATLDLTGAAWDATEGELAGVGTEASQNGRLTLSAARVKPGDDLPAADSYLPPSDIAALSAGHFGDVDALAYRHAMELVSLGGLGARKKKWIVAVSDTAADAAELPPGSFPFRALAAQGTQEKRVCVVREHGALWLSVFACSADNRAGSRRTLADLVSDAERIGDVAGRWRLDGVLGTLKPLDAECASTKRELLPSSALVLRRSGATVVGFLRLEMAFERPAKGKCDSEPPFAAGGKRSVYTVDMRVDDVAVERRGVTLTARVPPNSDMVESVGKLGVDPKWVGFGAGFALRMRLTPFDTFMFVDVATAPVGEQNPANFEAWPDGPMWATYAGGADRLGATP